MDNQVLDPTDLNQGSEGGEVEVPEQPQTPTTDVVGQETSSTEADTQTQPVTVGNRSYNNLEDMATSYSELMKDYTKKSQQLSELQKVIQGDENPQSLTPQQQELERQKKEAFQLMKEEGKFMTEEDYQKQNETRDFISDRNAKAKYEDLRITPDEVKVLEARAKMGIPLGETYNALKAQAMLRHAGEEGASFVPKSVSTGVGQARTDQDIGATIKEADLTKDKLNENIDKIYDSTGAQNLVEGIQRFGVYNA
jgi:predicted CopG family antitoxin